MLFQSYVFFQIQEEAEGGEPSAEDAEAAADDQWDWLESARTAAFGKQEEVPAALMLLLPFCFATIVIIIIIIIIIITIIIIIIVIVIVIIILIILQ